MRRLLAAGVLALGTTACAPTSSQEYTQTVLVQRDSSTDFWEWSVSDTGSDVCVIPVGDRQLRFIGDSLCDALVDGEIRVVTWREDKYKIFGYELTRAYGRRVELPE